MSLSPQSPSCKNLGPLSVGLGLILLAGCAIGPNYKRPPTNEPAVFRGEGQASTNSFADLPWWQVFNDEQLQALIRIALTNNYDLRVAFTRVEQARQVVAEARSQFLPQVNYTALAGRGKNVSPSGGGPVAGLSTSSVFIGDLNAAWEIDLWGGIRRLNESARAQYFASEDARRDITTSVIAQVAQSYFQLLALDRQLSIAEEATNSFGESLKLFNDRFKGGVASRLETSSAEALLENAAAAIPEFRRQRSVAENQLSVLLGQNPGPITREGSDFDKQWPPEVPAGLPSSLLERRPDIRVAEQQLRSANAQVGVAEANLLPQLTLSGLLGKVSPELSTITAGSANAWSAAADLSGPLFHGGQLRAQYRQAKDVRDQFALQYQQTVLNALQEVSSALVSRLEYAESRARLSRAVADYQEATKIAMERYRRGQSSYYEVLQEQQLLFPAENSLAETQLNQLTVVVQLYRALGGGWQPQEQKTNNVAR